MKRIITITFAVLLFVTPVSVKSTSPAPVPDEKTRWFNVESITVDIPSDLPAEGFEVRPASPSPYLEFRHTGKNPIFLQIEDASDYDGDIVGYPEYKEDDYYNDPEIPNILQFPSVPNYKLLNEKIFEYKRGYPSYTNYKLVENNSNWLKIHIRKLDPKIEKALKKGDGRPEGVAIPEPISFTYQVLYSTHHDNQFYDVTGTIKFALNETYESTAKQDAVNAANRAYHDMMTDQRSDLNQILNEFIESVSSIMRQTYSWLSFSD
jgi:hypothetical protein